MLSVLVLYLTPCCNCRRLVCSGGRGQRPRGQWSETGKAYTKHHKHTITHHLRPCQIHLFVCVLVSLRSQPQTHKWGSPHKASWGQRGERKCDHLVFTEASSYPLKGYIGNMSVVCVCVCMLYSDTFKVFVVLSICYYLLFISVYIENTYKKTNICYYIIPYIVFFIQTTNSTWSGIKPPSLH